ncbi:GGDEF domain-containing protein [Alsobacter sp. SYSU M60028]|uniref:diguanylate cyclase n=1 Tax=Alsobacter ponti TaxID=2962936 RepID=A0ABT1LJ82_9HYPH|nr:GGDEF domain-containing protein [Alsobacter ponti]MCP8940293.1 GGDEF domain-containing protein [Alsobacter ponti]
MSDVASSLRTAEQAIQLMRAHGASGDPRAYHVFYAHCEGQRPALSTALTRLMAAGTPISPAQTDALYEEHLSDSRFAAVAESTGGAVLTEVGALIMLIQSAIGSNDEFTRSLAALTTDLDEASDGDRVRATVRRLLVATQQTIAANRSLEASLRQKRDEVQELRETLEAIRTESLTDPLTMLANRKHLDNMIDRCSNHAALSGEPLSLLMVDVDRFKQFNDTWGHLTGDQVLRLVALSIRAEVRSIDTAARFGGEEFAVLLPQTKLSGALEVAERIRKTVMGRELVKRSTGEALGRLTVSIGVATFGIGDTAAMLLDRADKCLLEAKRRGRNRTVCETPNMPAMEPFSLPHDDDVTSDVA